MTLAKPHRAAPEGMRSILQQIASTAPSTVRYDQFGQPFAIDKAGMNLQLFSTAHPSMHQAVRQYPRSASRA